MAENQNEFARQNILNLSPSEKERLSQQQIVFNEIEKDQIPSNVNFPLIKNAEGMVIKYDPNVIELKKWVTLLSSKCWNMALIARVKL